MSLWRIGRNGPLTLSIVLGCLASLLCPLSPTTGSGGAASAAVARQDLASEATLETRQPEVQWSIAGATEWQGVPTQQPVRMGDRVRTGPDAAARLIYFEGTLIELGPQTGLLVERLEPSAGGNILTRLYQSAGTTVSRVIQLVDPAARFEIETPAATALVRGTTPVVQVAPSGTTRVASLPDETGGLVDVQSKDPAATVVTLQPGEETEVVPGRAPLPPVPLGTLPPLGPSEQQAPEVPLAVPVPPALPLEPSLPLPLPVPPIAIRTPTPTATGTPTPTPSATNTATPTATSLATCADPAAVGLTFSLVSRSSQFQGRVRIVGVVRNLGDGAAARVPVVLYEDSQPVATQEFQNLQPREEVTVVYERGWNASSSAEGEFPPAYAVAIVPTQGLGAECQSNNNRLERSGAEINALFRVPLPSTPTATATRRPILVPRADAPQVAPTLPR